MGYCIRIELITIGAVAIEGRIPEMKVKPKNDMKMEQILFRRRIRYTEIIYQKSIHFGNVEFVQKKNLQD